MLRLTLSVLVGLVTFLIALAQSQSPPPLYASVGDAATRLPASNETACAEGDSAGRPARPAGITASISDGAVVLKWTTCSAILDRYEIKRGNSADINAGAKTIADRISKDDESFSDGDVKPRQTYYYWVIAFAGKTNSYLPDPVSVTVPAPPEEERLIPDALAVQGALVELFLAKSVGDDVMAGRYRPPSATPTPVPAPAYSPALGRGGGAVDPPKFTSNGESSASRADQMRAVWESLAAQVVFLDTVRDGRKKAGILDEFSYLGKALLWGIALRNTAGLIADGTITREEGDRLWSLVPGEPPSFGIVMTAAAFIELLERSVEESYAASTDAGQPDMVDDPDQLHRVAARLQVQRHWLENQLASQSEAEPGPCPRDNGCFPDIVETVRDLSGAALDRVAAKPGAKSRWTWAARQVSRAFAAGGHPIGGAVAAQSEPPWFRPMVDQCKALGGKVARYGGFGFACRWASKTNNFPCKYFVDAAGQVTPDTAPLCAPLAPSSFTGAVPGEPAWYRRALEDCKIRPGMPIYFTGFAVGCKWTSVDPPLACIYYVDSVGRATSNDVSPACRLAIPRSYGAVPNPSGPASPLTFRPPPPLPPAQLGKEYSFWFCDSAARTPLLCGSLIPAGVNNPTGGVQPYTFEKVVLSGFVPTGLKLGFGGHLHGTATRESDAGKSFNFTVCAVDQLRNSSCQPVQLTVEVSPTFDGTYQGPLTDGCTGGTVEGMTSRTGAVTLNVQGNSVISGSSVEGHRLSVSGISLGESGRVDFAVSMFGGSVIHQVMATFARDSVGAGITATGTWRVTYQGAIVSVTCSGPFSLRRVAGTG